LLDLLKRESLGIIPEGVAGVTEGATPELERLYIMNRKGFVRVAIQAGAGTPLSRNQTPLPIVQRWGPWGKGGAKTSPG
jgi:hypothetical protein